MKHSDIKTYMTAFLSKQNIKCTKILFCEFSLNMFFKRHNIKNKCLFVYRFYISLQDTGGGGGVSKANLNSVQIET